MRESPSGDASYRRLVAVGDASYRPLVAVGDASYRPLVAVGDASYRLRRGKPTVYWSATGDASYRGRRDGSRQAGSTGAEALNL